MIHEVTLTDTNPKRSGLELDLTFEAKPTSVYKHFVPNGTFADILLRGLANLLMGRGPGAHAPRFTPSRAPRAEDFVLTRALRARRAWKAGSKGHNEIATTVRSWLKTFND